MRILSLEQAGMPLYQITDESDETIVNQLVSKITNGLLPDIMYFIATDFDKSYILVEELANRKFVIASRDQWNEHIH